MSVTTVERLLHNMSQQSESILTTINLQLYVKGYILQMLSHTSSLHLSHYKTTLHMLCNSPKSFKELIAVTGASR